MLSRLIIYVNHWLPSIVNTYIHCDNLSTNRVEGFFGNLKRTFLDQQVKETDYVLKSVHNLAEIAIKNSLSVKQIDVPIDLLLEKDSKRIGNFALSIILDQYTSFINAKSDDVVEDNCNCICYRTYEIPCKHILYSSKKENKNPLLTLEDISLRWQYEEDRMIIKNDQAIGEFIKTERNQSYSEDFSYGGCVSKFEYFFSIAEKNSSVQDALRQMLEMLNSMRIQSGEQKQIQPPPLIPNSGKPFSTPRKNSEKGFRPVNNHYFCGNCGQKGHNRRTCPKPIY